MERNDQIEIRESEPMTRREKFIAIVDCALIVLIIIFIIILIYFIVVFKLDAFQCLSNPILYFEELRNANCNCMMNLTNYALSP